MDRVEEELQRLEQLAEDDRVPPKADPVHVRGFNKGVQYAVYRLRIARAGQPSWSRLREALEMIRSIDSCRDFYHDACGCLSDAKEIAATALGKREGEENDG